MGGYSQQPYYWSDFFQWKPDWRSLQCIKYYYYKSSTRRRQSVDEDGAPPHYYIVGTRVRRSDNESVGDGGVIEWPSMSPDLTPLDVFLWGHLKIKVYSPGRFKATNSTRMPGKPRHLTDSSWKN